MYIPLMESSQLITILILILALLTAGILLLARQLARRGSDSIAADPEAERVRFDRDQLQAELERTREELSVTRQELQAAIEARSKAEQRYEDHAQEAENRRTELKREFDLLARDIIEKNAERHQKHLSEGGKETLSAVVKPIQEKFVELQNQMNKFYGDEREQLGQLDKELEKLFSLNQSLQAEAKHLTNALKGESKVQGDWGEYQLERILEQVGLVEGIHYSKQSSQRDEAGKLYRPDFLIYLPEDKVLIIDSKVSLTSYERMTQAEDPAVIEQERTAHAASVSAHIKGLGKKKLRRTLWQEHRLHTDVHAGGGVVGGIGPTPPAAAGRGARPKRPARFNQHLDRDPAHHQLRLAAGRAKGEHPENRRARQQALPPDLCISGRVLQNPHPAHPGTVFL